MTCVMASSAVATASSSELLRAVMYSSALVCSAQVACVSSVMQRRSALIGKRGMTTFRSVMQQQQSAGRQVIANTRTLPAEGYTSLSYFRLWTAGNGRKAHSSGWCADEG